VPLRLRRRPSTEPATALVLWSQSVEDLLSLCARLGGDKRPEIFQLPDGFLLKLAAPTVAVCPNTVRLRQRAENLFLRVDAELVPTLLDDEARGLTRERGLVFLPGGRVDAFPADQPLPLSALLKIDRLRRHDWQPLPTPPFLAERINSIVLDLPDAPPEK